MTRIILIISLMLTVGAERQKAAEDAWLRVKTRNFTIIGNAGEKDLQKVAWRLEQFREAVLRIFRGRQNHSNPITVIVFRNEESYRPFKPLYEGRPTTVTGYFQASDDKSYITLAIDRRDNDVYAIIFHEYVHVLTNSFHRRLPAWINEGLAEYFTTFQLSRGEDKVELGLPVTSHIQQMRNQRMLPIDQLFAIDEASPAYNELDKKRIFYAQSWALVHYLLMGNERERQKPFFDLLDNYTPDRPFQLQFRESFEVDPKEIELGFRQYVARGNYPSERIPLGEKLRFDASMQTESLAPAERDSYLGDLLWRIKRPREADRYLRRALAIDPDSAFTHKTIGILYFRDRRYTDARKHLEKAVRLDPNDYLTQYMFATALQWEQVDETHYVSGFSAESIPEMRRALNRAIELNPEFPDGFKQLGFMLMVLDEDLDQAASMLERCMAIAPDRHDCAYTLAQVHVRRRQYIEARKLLNRILESKLKTDVHENAARLLAVIDSVEESLARQNTERETQAETSPASGGEPKPPERPEPGKRFSGDQVRGMLTRIDCNDLGTTLTVRSNGRLYRFYSPKENSLVFVRYTPEIPTEITCGVNLSDRPVIVTYRKSNAPKSRIEGEPIGVEFLKN